MILAVNVAMAAPSEQQQLDLSKSISQFSLDLYQVSHGDFFFFFHFYLLSIKQSVKISKKLTPQQSQGQSIHLIEMTQRLFITIINIHMFIEKIFFSPFSNAHLPIKAILLSHHTP